MARGTDEENKVYCMKQGDLLLEVGTPAPKSGTNTSFTVASELTDKVVAGASIGELISENKDYKAAFFKHSRSINDTVDEMKRYKYSSIKKDTIKNLCLTFYPWQVELYDMLTKTEPQQRSIYWYYDDVGCAGKTTFAQYYKARHPAKIIQGGKINDLSYSYDYEPVVFFDIARSEEMKYLNRYIEQIKNGFVFSAKYKSYDKDFQPPHVVVFSNKLPDCDSFSRDRLVIRDITHPLRYVPAKNVQKKKAVSTISKGQDQEELRAASPTPSTSAVPPQETVGPLHEGKKSLESSSSR